MTTPGGAGPGVAAAFDVASSATRPVLLGFCAPWSPHCVQMSPVLEEVTREFAGRVDVVPVEVVPDVVVPVEVVDAVSSELVLPVVDVVPVVLVVDAVEAVLESDAASTVVAEARPKPRPAAASTPAAAVTTVVRFTRWSRSSRPWGVQLLVISSSCGSSSVI